MQLTSTVPFLSADAWMALMIDILDRARDLNGIAVDEQGSSATSHFNSTARFLRHRANAVDDFADDVRN